MRIFLIENQDHCCFSSHDSTHFKSQHQRTLRLLFGDCRLIYFYSLMKSVLLVSKGLLCLYDKQNNTWLLVDMEFLFSCSTRHLTRSLRSLVSYRVKHSKINSISTRAHVLFPFYEGNKKLPSSTGRLETKVEHFYLRRTVWDSGNNSHFVPFLWT